MNRLQILVTATLLATGAFAADPPQQPHTGFYGWEIRGTFWSDVNHIDTITGVPVSYRQVPGHPDDPWHGQIFTIPGTTLSPGALVVTSGDFLLLWRTKHKNVISFGPSWVTSGLSERYLFGCF